VLEVITVKEVKGVEGDETAVGMDDVDAGFLDGTDIEDVGTEEMDSEDAENIFVGEVRRSGNVRKATQEFAEAGSAGFGGMVGGKEFEEAIADARLFFVDDGVAGSVDEDVGLDKTSQRNDFATEFEGIGHSEGIWVAWNRDDILGAEDAGLLENFAADFRKGKTVRGGIKFLDAARILDGLEGNAADARLRRGEVDDLADFAVVETFAESDNEGGREIVQP
jgi:hypothetical protein